MRTSRFLAYCCSASLGSRFTSILPQRASFCSTSIQQQRDRQGGGRSLFQQRQQEDRQSHPSKQQNMADHDVRTSSYSETTTTAAAAAAAGLGSTGMRSFVDGKHDGPTIVFVHGWPDDHTMWDEQVTHLKDRFRCVTTDLPGFSKDDVNEDKWGYTIDEVVKRLERTVEAAGKGQPVVIIAHDWGCIFSFLLEKKRPDLVRKMVAIDVGGALQYTPLGFLFVIAYHLWLIAAFVLGGSIGDAMAQSFAWLAGSPARSNVARASVCYPYYQWWKLRLSKETKIQYKEMLPLVPRAPLLFLYGVAGPKAVLPFHADWWVEELDRKEGSASVPMKKSSHWVTRDEPDEVNRRIDDFLAEK